MATYYADLHSHSTASDGSDPPARVVERAKAAGLSVMALTDHDTVAGVAEAQEAGKRLGVRVIAGTELTCYIGKREVHVLGYGMDIHHGGLAEHCARFQEARIARARLIGERLAAAGAPIDMEAVVAESDGGVVGRPHIAKALIAAGHVKDFQEAFDRFLGEGGPANVHKLNVSPEQCVAVIREAGGVAVMAHPALGEQYDLVPALIAAGAVGIEVWHSAHDWAATDRLHKMALERGLAKTGGSDCHGSIKGQEPILGRFGHQLEGWRAFEKVMEKG
jgi:hypothetical protein